MPAKSRGVNEFDLGLKQIFGIVVSLAVVLGIAFAWGFEAGHRRATRGESSLLGVLEGDPDRFAKPVEIPKVLLEPFDDGGVSEPNRDKPSPAMTALAESPPPTLGTRPPEEPVAQQVPVEKPPPAQPTAAPAPAPVAAPASSGGEKPIRYQVAAIRAEKNATELAAWLRSEGYPATVAQKSPTDGLHRVYVGPFNDPVMAAQFKARLSRDGFDVILRRF